MEDTKFVNIPAWQPFHICLDCDLQSELQTPFPGRAPCCINKLARGDQLCIQGSRHNSPQCQLRGLGHLTPCFLSIISCRFPQPPLSDRPSPPGPWRFVNTDFTPELPGKHPQPAAPAPPSEQCWLVPGLAGIAWMFLTGCPAVGGLSPGFCGPVTICRLERTLPKCWSWSSHHLK